MPGTLIARLWRVYRGIERAVWRFPCVESSPSEALTKHIRHLVCDRASRRSSPVYSLYDQRLCIRFFTTSSLLHLEATMPFLGRILNSPAETGANTDNDGGRRTEGTFESTQVHQADLHGAAAGAQGSDGVGNRSDADARLCAIEDRLNSLESQPGSPTAFLHLFLSPRFKASIPVLTPSTAAWPTSINLILLWNTNSPTSSMMYKKFSSVTV